MNKSTKNAAYELKSEGLLAAPAVSDASDQYLARWMPEDGGKAVIVANWNEVLTAATLFMKMGANKIEIETVREMKPGVRISDPAP